MATVTLMTPGSILSQLTNLFFLASGLFNDLLVIRLCLTIAYSFLLVSGLLGLPAWGSGSQWTGRIALDVVVWSFVNIVLVHGSGVIRMYYDERPIVLESHEHEMLWRFFYRHSGLSKAQFQAIILPHLKLTTFVAGDLIPCSEDFYILLDGMVLCDLVHRQRPKEEEEAYSPTPGQKIRLASGDLFPLIHIYKHYMPRECFLHWSTIKRPIIESPTCRAFSIPLKELQAMAVLPHARDAWTSLLIAALAEIAERQYVQSGGEFGSSAFNASSDDEPSVVTNSVTAHRLSSAFGKGFREQSSTSFIHPLFRPLEASERPDPVLAGSGGGLVRPLRHLGRYLVLSVYMPWPWGGWPVGLRHALRPPKTNEDVSDSDNEPRAGGEWDRKLPPSPPDGSSERSMTVENHRVSGVSGLSSEA